LVDGHATGRGTALAGGAKAAPYGTVNSQVEIGVVENDDDVLAAHFEAAMLEVGCASLGDQTADGAGAREAHNRNLPVRRKRRASIRAVATDQIHDAGRQASLSQHLNQVIGR